MTEEQKIRIKEVIATNQSTKKDDSEYKVVEGTNYNKRNSGHKDSFGEGQEFENFLNVELGKRHLIIQNISNSKNFQNNNGENLQGWEIKLDNRCTGDKRTKATNQLAIEIAEKTNGSNSNWCESGIYRDDSSWLYIQGNTHQVWIFGKKVLIRLHQSGNYGEHSSPEELPTIKKFYLPIAVADEYCEKKITFK